MRGHEPLIAMRRRGQHPPTVFIGLETDRLRCWRHWHSDGMAPTIEVEPGETIGRLDLRCVRGLVVIADGDDFNRLAALCEACMAHGARRVVASAMSTDHRGDPKVVSVIDTEGSWPS